MTHLHILIQKYNKICHPWDNLYVFPLQCSATGHIPLPWSATGDHPSVVVCHRSSSLCSGLPQGLIPLQWSATGAHPSAVVCHRSSSLCSGLPQGTPLCSGLPQELIPLQWSATGAHPSDVVCHRSSSLCSGLPQELIPLQWSATGAHPFVVEHTHLLRSAKTASFSPESQ